MSKLCLLIIVLSQLLSACSHREVFSGVSTRVVLVPTDDQKACTAKGIRWQMVEKKGCIVRDFLGYCQLQNPPASIAKTVNYLKNEVNLSHCEEVDSALRKVSSLYLSDYQIEDIYPLVGFTQLQVLVLDHNALVDLTPLAGMHQLRLLRLDKNRIRDVSHLRSLTNLVLLRLDQNTIVDVSPLRGLTKLARLNLSGNSVKDISPLGELRMLRKLGLANNRLEDLGPLSQLFELEYLHVEDNPVTSSATKMVHPACPQGIDTPRLLKEACTRDKS